MLSKILKVMLIVILIPLFTVCSVVVLEMGEGAKQGYEQAKEEAEASA